MARLPQPGGDPGKWAHVLNEFLMVSHNPDGTLRNTNPVLLASTSVAAPTIGLSDLKVLNPPSQPLRNLLLSNDGTNLIWKQTIEINVRNYGAVGDGVTDDTDAIQAAINDTSDGGAVVFPRGIFAVRTLKIINKGTSLVGNGRWATRIVRLNASTDPIVDMSGSGTALGHTRYNTIQDLTMSGNNMSGPLVRSYYADNCIFRGVSFLDCPSLTTDFVEVWDSRFEDCSWENCGSLAEPVMLFRNTTAPGTFGFSTDNTNQIHFVFCRWEGFRNGAIKLDGGANGSTNLLNGFFLTSCKMETSVAAGPVLQIMEGSTIVFVNQLYIAILGKDPSLTTPIDAIVDYGSQVDLSDVYAQWADGLASSTIHAFKNVPHTYRNISAYYPIKAPTLATIAVEPGAEVNITPPWTNQVPTTIGQISTFMTSDSELGTFIALKNSGSVRISSATTGKDLVRADNDSLQPTFQTLNGADFAGCSGDYTGEKWRFHGGSGFVSLASGKFQVEGTKGYVGIGGIAPYTGIGLLVKAANDTDRGLAIVRKSATSSGRMLEFQDETNNIQGIAFDTYGRPISVGSVANVRGGTQVAYANVRIQARDTAGSVAAAMLPHPVPGSIAIVTFAHPYSNAPLSITLTDHSPAPVDLYVSDRSGTGFTVSTRQTLPGGSFVNFDYLVIASG